MGPFAPEQHLRRGSAWDQSHCTKVGVLILTWARIKELSRGGPDRQSSERERPEKMHHDTARSREIYEASPWNTVVMRR
jgi:hypothetical protein